MNGGQLGRKRECHCEDPASEKFESFPSDKRGAAVRQMLGRPGEAWGAESGTDRLVVVKD